MRRQHLLLVILLGYPIFFSAETAAANEGSVDSEGGAVGGAIIKVWNNPEFAQTEAGGSFSAPISLAGKVTDTTILHNPLAGVAVFIPYYGQELTGTTNAAGEFTTNKISFGGTVVNDANEPIANAWVSLSTIAGEKAKPLTDTSDANGAFGNGGLVGIHAPSTLHQRNRRGALLRGNRLMVALSANQTITISLFTITGRRFFSHSIDNLSDRARSIELPELSAGFYLLKVTTGTYAATFKQVFFSQQRLMVYKSEVRGSRSAATAKKRSAGAIVPDTLVALADGYLTGSLAVSDDNTSGLKITLTPSNQWKPAGPLELEHQGSMVKIKANGHNFSMGQPVMLSENIDQVLWELEVPVHTVSFTYDFWMDTTEVTQKQYADVMTAGYTNYGNSNWSGTYGSGDSIPAYSLSYGDAMLYCNARSKADGLDTVYSYTGTAGDPGELIELKGLVSDFSKNGYRLATEAEWEYACRGGTVTDFYWNKNYRPYPETVADTAEINDHVLWGPKNGVSSSDPDYAVRSGAASKKPNNYGLYDMSGSLSEWTQAGEGWFTGEAVIDPKPTTSPQDTIFMYRGGNWGNNAAYLRPACRSWAFANYPYWHIGFRTVREVR
ncbi:MAG: SUMF1/EgtB/PvdO family nonheme iron enzyme [Chitinispirillaceae bacterium]|nr:SUMF1/EgtB/PvdO family nonheme iron enzyme [Chitinispirillaceae bacterium]